MDRYTDLSEPPPRVPDVNALRVLMQQDCQYCNSGWAAESKEQLLAMKLAHMDEFHPEVAMGLRALRRLDELMPLLETLAAARVVEVAK